jgi:hypothetical protein
VLVEAVIPKTEETKFRIRIPSLMKRGYDGYRKRRR